MKVVNFNEKGDALSSRSARVVIFIRGGDNNLRTLVKFMLPRNSRGKAA
jgi:ribosomal protein L13